MTSEHARRRIGQAATKQTTEEDDPLSHAGVSRERVAAKPDGASRRVNNSSALRLAMMMTAAPWSASARLPQLAGAIAGSEAKRKALNALLRRRWGHGRGLFQRVQIELVVARGALLRAARAGLCRQTAAAASLPDVCPRRLGGDAGWLRAREKEALSSFPLTAPHQFGGVVVKSCKPLVPGYIEALRFRRRRWARVGGHIVSLLEVYMSGMGWAT